MDPSQINFQNMDDVISYAKNVAGAMVERHLFEMLVKDPLSNYQREQDHFIKYAPKWEVQAWIDWNKNKKKTNLNKFGAGTTNSLRELGDIPRYIEFYYDYKYPGYWEIARTGPAREQDMKRIYGFFKRNPLFCTAEVV